MSKSQTRALLLEQFEISWALAWYHLETLTTAECLWRPADPCLHVSLLDAGRWRPDWPDSEGYEIGPPSIAWTTWHITYWWEKAIAHLADDEHVDAGDMYWPGTAEEVRANIVALKDRWRVTIESYNETAFLQRRENSWPIPGAAPQTIAAWLNVELMKNAAEIGMARFMHAVSAE